MNSNPTDTIVDQTDTEYTADLYYESTKAVGNQQWVANQWADGALPTHESGNLRTSTGNFCGKQYPDGHGRLVHYSTTEAIRTRNGLIISNAQCYSRGFAHCTTPNADYRSNEYLSLPLTSLESRYNDLPDVYDIREVRTGDDDENGYDRLVVYDDGAAIRANKDGYDGTSLTELEAANFLAAIDA